MNLTSKNIVSLFEPKIGEELNVDAIKALISSWVGPHTLPNGGRLKTRHIGIDEISCVGTIDQKNEIRPAYVVSIYVADQGVSLSLDGNWVLRSISPKRFSQIEDRLFAQTH